MITNTQKKPNDVMKYIVGVSDMKLSSGRGDIVVTHALGSCIGIAIHDQKACVGGILHYMLPLSIVDIEKARNNPLMFGDSGIPMFFEAAYNLGATKENLRVVMAGGARVFEKSDFFDIGQRNTIIARKLFWKNNILVAAENIGGNAPRTMYLEIGSGATWFTSRGEKYLL